MGSHKSAAMNKKFILTVLILWGEQERVLCTQITVVTHHLKVKQQSFSRCKTSYSCHLVCFPNDYTKIQLIILYTLYKEMRKKREGGQREARGQAKKDD